MDLDNDDDDDDDDILLFQNTVIDFNAKTWFGGSTSLTARSKTHCQSLRFVYAQRRAI